MEVGLRFGCSMRADYSINSLFSKLIRNCRGYVNRMIVVNKSCSRQLSGYKKQDLLLECWPLLGIGR